MECVESNPNNYYQAHSQLQDFQAYFTTLEDAFTVILRDAVKIPLTFINMTDKDWQYCIISSLMILLWRSYWENIHVHITIIA